MINNHDNFNQIFKCLNMEANINEIEEYKTLLSSEYNEYITFNIKNNKLIYKYNKDKDNDNEEYNKIITIDINIKKDKIFINVKLNDFVIVIIRADDIDYFYDLNGINYLKVPVITKEKEIACFDKYNLKTKFTNIIIYSINQVILNLNNITGKIESIEYDKMNYIDIEFNKLLICLYPDTLPLFCYRSLPQSNEFSCMHVILKLKDNIYKATNYNQLIEYNEFDSINNLNYNYIKPFLFLSTNNLTYTINIYKIYKENNINELNNKIINFTNFITITNSYLGQHYSIGLFVLKHKSLLFYYLFNSINNIGLLFDSNKKLLVSNIIINKCYIENEKTIIFLGPNNKFTLNL